MIIDDQLYQETVVLVNEILADVNANSYDRFNAFVQQNLNSINDVDKARTISVAVLNLKHKIKQNWLLHKKYNLNSPCAKEKIIYKFQTEYCEILYNLSMQYFNTVV